MNSNQVHTSILDDMKTFVSQDANRSISFTNKEAAFYFTQSHHTDHVEHAFLRDLILLRIEFSVDTPYS